MSTTGPKPGGSIVRRTAAPCSRAERQEQRDLPWLSTVKFPWGLEARLVNISSTGLLFESPSKLTPGTVMELTLCGAGIEVSVPVCFVRSEVALVDHLGVKYRTAVTFEKALNLQGLRPHKTSSGTAGLSELLALVSAELDRDSPASLRNALERAVCRAMKARDVQIRDMPTVPSDGSESFYFPLPAGTGSSLVLQAMFAPGYEPTDAEIKLLNAAAGLAAVVLGSFSPP